MSTISQLLIISAFSLSWLSPRALRIPRVVVPTGVVYNCATCSLLVLLVVLDVNEISVTPTDVRTAAVRAPCMGTFSLADSQPVSAKRKEEKRKSNRFISHRVVEGRKTGNERWAMPRTHCRARSRALSLPPREGGGTEGSCRCSQCQHVPSR